MNPSPPEAPIKAYVQGQITQIMKGDKGSAQAREELCRQCESTERVPVSAGFQTLYVRLVRAEIGPMLKDPDVTHRLNGAIIIYRLANSTHIGDLQTEAVQLCGDQSPAIALWGVKAAGALIPSVMQIGMNIPRQPLTAAIVKTVQTHANSGAIIQDAYTALDVSGVNPPLAAPAINACTNAILEIVRMRINDAIEHMPASPQSDWGATKYLASTAVMNAAATPDKLKIVQSMLDLASVSAQRAAETPVNEEKDRLVDMVTLCGGSLKVLMLAAQSPAAGDLDKVIKCKTAPVAKVDEIVRSVVPSLKTTFAGIVDPPKVKPLAQPTTAP